MQTVMLTELILEEFMVLKQAVLYDPCPGTTNTILKYQLFPHLD